MKLYLVAGEASGDARGAELMRALHAAYPDFAFFGAGGPEMRRLAEGEFFDWAGEAVVGLWDVLKKYGYFRAQFRRMLGEILRRQPDALVLIDYPGFNLRLARAARAACPALKIIYYISPQVWAWNRGRIPKMARILDLMLCIFPFEKPLYEESGLETVFVGHPMLDSLAAKKTREPRDPGLVALFPGSRSKEVRKIFPVMLKSALLLCQRAPGLRFEAAAASPSLAGMMQEQLQAHGISSDAFCAVGLQNSHDLMQRATVGMVCSGTATLEAAFFELPIVILYKVAWLTSVVGKRLVRVPFLGMPNLLAGKEIAPEFLQDAATPESIAAAVYRLGADPIALEEARRELAEVIVKLGEPGAAQRAAAAICEALHLQAP
ncbi:MAG: lipid-A-disaccharide synthase [Verrucomicrobiota bacterium]|nr:lipid-A-disaccharide synthase [Verrucomicrobiota bacterium]